MNKEEQIKLGQQDVKDKQDAEFAAQKMREALDGIHHASLATHHITPALRKLNQLAAEAKIRAAERGVDPETGQPVA